MEPPDASGEASSAASLKGPGKYRLDGPQSNERWAQLPRPSTQRWVLRCAAGCCDLRSCSRCRIREREGGRVCLLQIGKPGQPTIADWRRIPCAGGDRSSAPRRAHASRQAPVAARAKFAGCGLAAAPFGADGAGCRWTPDRRGGSEKATSPKCVRSGTRGVGMPPASAASAVMGLPPRDPTRKVDGAARLAAPPARRSPTPRPGHHGRGRAYLQVWPHEAWHRACGSAWRLPAARAEPPSPQGINMNRQAPAVSEARGHGIFSSPLAEPEPAPSTWQFNQQGN